MKSVEKFALMIGLIGIILIFISVWVSGWLIVRLLITGILLILWGKSIREEAEK
jgi:hypothetical protein